MKIANPTVIIPPLNIEIPRQNLLGPSVWQWPCPWTDCAEPPSPAQSPRACHAPSPLPGPCCRARLFLLIHALKLWGRGLELGTKFRRGGAGRQLGIHTRCTRNVQAECLASQSPEEAAQPPCPTSLLSCLWSAVLSLILLRAPADFPNSSPPPHSNPPQTLLPAEFTKNKSVELITDLTK